MTPTGRLFVASEICQEIKMLRTMPRTMQRVRMIMLSAIAALVMTTPTWAAECTIERDKLDDALRATPSCAAAYRLFELCEYVQAATCRSAPSCRRNARPTFSRGSMARGKAPIGRSWRSAITNMPKRMARCTARSRRSAGPALRGIFPRDIPDSGGARRGFAPIHPPCRRRRGVACSQHAGQSVQDDEAACFAIRGGREP